MTAKQLPAPIRAEIIDRRKRGESYKQIASSLRLTKGQVAGTLWRAGLCVKKSKEFGFANNATTNA